MENFSLDPSEYELKEVVGTGANSIVYHAEYSGRSLAVKLINIDSPNIELDMLKKQLGFWSKCHQPNIVTYYGSFLSAHTLWVLTELMGGGSIEDILKYAYPTGIKDETLISTIIAEVIKALIYFHSNKQIHRDIRTATILLSTQGEVKIGNVGLATSLIQGGRRKGSTLSMYGEACYMAPEVLKSENGYSEKTDIWSLGLMAIELATGKMPFASMKFMEAMVQIINHDPPQLSPSFSASFRDFVKICLTVDPQKRANASSLLEHKFIKQSKGSQYVFEKLISVMPPLSQRHQRLHGTETSPVMEASSPPKQILFDFGEPPAPVVQQKSRFTVTRKASGAKRPVLMDLQDDITGLKKIFADLEKETEEIKENIAQIQVAIRNANEK